MLVGVGSVMEEHPRFNGLRSLVDRDAAKACGVLFCTLATSRATNGCFDVAPSRVVSDHIGIKKKAPFEGP